jgi:uncharacterized protein (DUF952 family)
VQAEWDAAGPRYAPTGFVTEGFIHCSSASQVAATAARGAVVAEHDVTAWTAGTHG